MLEHQLQHLNTMQFGGRPNKSIDFAIYYNRLIQAYAKISQYNIAFIFLDVRNAFYSVIRETLTTAGTSDQAAIHTLHQLNIPPIAIDNLKAIQPQNPKKPRTRWNHIATILDENKEPALTAQHTKKSGKSTKPN